MVSLHCLFRSYRMICESTAGSPSYTTEVVVSACFLGPIFILWFAITLLACRGGLTGLWVGSCQDILDRLFCVLKLLAHGVILKVIRSGVDVSWTVLSFSLKVCPIQSYGFYNSTVFISFSSYLWHFFRSFVNYFFQSSLSFLFVALQSFVDSYTILYRIFSIFFAII